MSHFQSLHSHTTASDGALEHQQLLDTALHHGIEVIAFTDHDSITPENTLKKLTGEVKWISGIEMSSGLPEKLGGGSNGPHIVGLFVDPTNTALQEYCLQAQQARIERMESIVKNLQSIGFTISADDCLKASGGEAVGRPHIVQALNSHEENAAVTKELLNKLEIQAKTDAQALEYWNIIQTSGEQQVPYKLFLSDEAYIKGIYVDKKYWSTFEQSVELIRNAGGLAFFAHYTFDKKTIPYTELENLLSINAIDGVETVYGLWSFGSPQETEINADRAHIRQLLAKYHKLPSGGADIHKVEDIENFGSSKEYASETIGMAEKIISTSGVSTKWSSFS